MTQAEHDRAYYYQVYRRQMRVGYIIVFGTIIIALSLLYKGYFNSWLPHTQFVVTLGEEASVARSAPIPVKATPQPLIYQPTAKPAPIMASNQAAVPTGAAIQVGDDLAGGGAPAPLPTEVPVQVPAQGAVQAVYNPPPPTAVPVIIVPTDVPAQSAAPRPQQSAPPNPSRKAAQGDK
jgi:hypothetical protein